MRSPGAAPDAVGQSVGANAIKARIINPRRMNDLTAMTHPSRYQAASLLKCGAALPKRNIQLPIIEGGKTAHYLLGMHHTNTNLLGASTRQKKWRAALFQQSNRSPIGEGDKTAFPCRLSCCL
jgi:hypothetical protein